MPLSEHEQRLLDGIERALMAEDPKFASTVRSTDLRTHHLRRLRSSGLLLILGLALLLGGAVSQQIWLGVLGFLVMLYAGTRAASVSRSMSGHAPRTPLQQTKTKGKKHKGSIASRSEERMRRRLEGDDR